MEKQSGSKVGRPRKNRQMSNGDEQIAEYLREIRKNNGDDYYPCVKKIIEARNCNATINANFCEPFLIRAILEFPVEKEETDRDVLLVAFNLLHGYRGKSLMERRRKYLFESGMATGDDSFNLLIPTKQENRASNSKDRENILITDLAQFINDIEDPLEYLNEAGEKYGKHVGSRYITHYPKPYYCIHTRTEASNNLPPRSTNFVGRDAFLATLRSNYISGKTLQIISGSGGVGKTQVAREYAHRHRYDYEYICWINAENEETMQASCNDLFVRTNFTVRDSETVRSALLRFFRDRSSWLIIFDNADYAENDEKRSLLKSFLPNNLNFQNNVLITMRYDSDFCGSEPIKILPFLPEESIKYIKTRLDIADTDLSNDENIKRLAARLGHYPLALSFATAYIRKSGKDIPAYLRILEERAMDVYKLGSDLYPVDEYQLCVRDALMITLDSLREKAEMDNIAQTDVKPDNLALIACQVVNFAAFLPSDYIDLDLFFCTDDEKSLEMPDDSGNETKAQLETLCSVCCDELERDKLIRLLEEYSLVARNGKYLSMHRVMQEIVRGELGAGGIGAVAWLGNRCVKLAETRRTEAAHEHDINSALRAMQESITQLQNLIYCYVRLRMPDLNEGAPLDSLACRLCMMYGVNVNYVIMNAIILGQCKDDGFTKRTVGTPTWEEGMRQLFGWFYAARQRGEIGEEYFSAIIVACVIIESYHNSLWDSPKQLASYFQCGIIAINEERERGFRNMLGATGAVESDLEQVSVLSYSLAICLGFYLDLLYTVCDDYRGDISLLDGTIRYYSSLLMAEDADADPPREANEDIMTLLKAEYMLRLLHENSASSQGGNGDASLQEIFNACRATAHGEIYDPVYNLYRHESQTDMLVPT